MSSLARKGPADLDRVRKAAERIVRNGHQASSLIGSIRAMLRKSSPGMAPVNINGVITDVIELVRGELSRHNIQLEMRLHPDVECVVGDRVQLQQVIVNLIQNGIESMREDAGERRLLRVSTSIDAAGSALIAVADSGTGVNAQAMSRIFEPSFTTQREGIGMGLSICRSIVEAHGGCLWATPRVPQGSVFQFTLPIAEAASAS